MNGVRRSPQMLPAGVRTPLAIVTAGERLAVERDATNPTSVRRLFGYSNEPCVCLPAPRNADFSYQSHRSLKFPQRYNIQCWSYGSILKPAAQGPILC